VPEELTLGYLNDFDRDLGIYQSDDAALENTIGESKVEHVIAGSEPGVELTDHLATRWKCPTRNVDALAASRRHKIAMQRRVKQVGLHTATSIEIRSSAEAKSAISSGLLSLPVVVKPPKSAGTDGVSICHNLQEMELSIEQLLNQYDRFHNLNDALLLQEFLYGEEYCVSAISAGGKHYFTDVWRYRKRSVSNTRVYECDELLDPAAEQSVTALEYSNSVLCAVGIRWGPSHTELMLTSNGPRLIEVAARLQGGVHPGALTDALGCDPIRLAAAAFVAPAKLHSADWLTARSLHFHQRRASLVCVHLIADAVGYLDIEYAVKCLEGSPTYFKGSFSPNVAPPYRVTKTVGLFSSPGFYYLTSVDKDQMWRDYEALRSAESNHFYRASPGR
jgi:hypothetical protein